MHSFDAFISSGLSSIFFFTKKLPQRFSICLIANVGTAGATITWTTDDASTTRVQYGQTTAYGVYTDLDVTPTTVHTATITGLFPDTTYNFDVQSEDSAGNTAISVNHTFTTESAPFTSGTMSVPVVSHITDTSITLSWNVPFDDSAGTEFYDIRYSTEPITQRTFEDATPAREGVEHIVHVGGNGQSTEHIYMIIELEAGTSYYFGIKSGASRSTLAHLEETRTDHSVALQSGNEGSQNTHARVGGNFHVQGNGTAAVRQGSSGISGGSRRLPAPRSIQAKGADREVAFVWTSPLNSTFIHTDIVRKLGSFPTSPTDGQTVYEGRDETFTDTNLTNGRKYHYAIYTHNEGETNHGFSKPVLLAMLPIEGVEQVDFREPVAHSASATVGGALKFGMRGNEVSDLQKLLAKDSSVYPEGLVTGYFGTLTQSAVQRLQEKHGLPPTGIADIQTQNLLLSVPVPTSPASPASPSASLERDLLEGSRGDDVRALQAFLKTQGLFPIDVTGYFGSYTLAGVKAFQNQYGLPATGTVSALTREKIRELPGH